MLFMFLRPLLWSAGWGSSLFGCPKRKTYMGPKCHTSVFGPVVHPLAMAVFGVLKGKGAVAIGVEGAGGGRWIRERQRCQQLWPFTGTK